MCRQYNLQNICKNSTQNKILQLRLQKQPCSYNSTKKTLTLLFSSLLSCSITIFFPPLLQFFLPQIELLHGTESELSQMLSCATNLKRHTPLVTKTTTTWKNPALGTPSNLSLLNHNFCT